MVSQINEIMKNFFIFNFICFRRFSSDRTSVPDTHNNADRDFLYFDMVTLWVAPIELDVEEESFVRIMR